MESDTTALRFVQQHSEREPKTGFLSLIKAIETQALSFLDCYYYWRWEQSVLRHRRLSDQIAPFRLVLPNSAAIAFVTLQVSR